MKSKNELKQIIEGILFVYGDDGVSLFDLQTVLETEKPSVIKQTILELEEKYAQDPASSLAIQKFNPDKYRLETKPVLYPYLAKLEDVQQQSKLTPATIEVLSIIAYKGPILKSEIDQIRGVDSTYQLVKLKEKSLIRVTGKNPESRAYLYAITDNFFKFFNLTSGLDSLPKIEVDEFDEEEKTTSTKTKDLFHHEELEDWQE